MPPSSSESWRGSLVVWCTGALVAIALIVIGCSQQRISLLADQARTPPTIRKACELAQRKCSRCHGLERIQLAHHNKAEWKAYVDRMRVMPGSGITGGDSEVILRCLDYISTENRRTNRLEPEQI
ncbi:MAG: hypothetical protein AB7P03_19190 [Kofleriaceae bacterium]